MRTILRTPSKSCTPWTKFVYSRACMYHMSVTSVRVRVMSALTRKMSAALVTLTQTKCSGCMHRGGTRQPRKARSHPIVTSRSRSHSPPSRCIRAMPLSHLVLSLIPMQLLLPPHICIPSSMRRLHERTAKQGHWPLYSYLPIGRIGAPHMVHRHRHPPLRCLLFHHLLARKWRAQGLCYP